MNIQLRLFLRQPSPERRFRSNKSALSSRALLEWRRTTRSTSHARVWSDTMDDIIAKTRKLSVRHPIPAASEDFPRQARHPAAARTIFFSCRECGYTIERKGCRCQKNKKKIRIIKPISPSPFPLLPCRCSARTPSFTAAPTTPVPSSP